VEPNPLVGAVIVRDGQILGVGHHLRFGWPHAETQALHDCARRGHTARGATMYVTLEPCNAPGKQPACVEAIIREGLGEVVFARSDPNPSKGGGASTLSAAGVRVRESRASPLATGVSAPFIKRLTTGLPWVIAKWAQTIDGRIATRTGESKWISGERSRARVHRLRGRVDAILTGLGTVLADDPLLTARLGWRPRRVAMRVVADADLEIPLRAQLVQTAWATPTIVACDQDLLTAEIVAEKRDALRAAEVRFIGVPTRGRSIDVRSLLQRLAAMGVSTVLVEAGPGLLGSLVDQGLIDEAVVYVAPMILGDDQARAVAVGRVAESLAMAQRFDLWRVKALDGDVELTYRSRASGV
jgi:diaminohydroxyphosphoribosylaminopyrimidine deaminase/5-amino-6-(5-phosphoribosylamino)uracil reductase